MGEGRSRLVMRCRREEYCASHICRAIEDCDGQVIRLSVTDDDKATDMVSVDLLISLRDPRPAVRSLARQGYDASATESGDELLDESLRERINELIRRLDI